MSDQYDTIVFQPTRNAVYYIYDRRPGKSDLVTIYVNQKEGPLVGHAGFPSFFSLQSLSLENDVLTVYCEASSTEDKQETVKHFGLQSGVCYRVPVDLQATKKRQVAPSDLRDFYPMDGGISIQLMKKLRRFGA